MKVTSLLSISLFGFATYLFLEFFFGSYGILAYRAMERYVDRAEERYESVEEIQQDLRLQVHLLTTDAETIRLEARDVGYIQEGERIVRVEGHSPRSRHRYMPGAAPPPLPRPRDNRALFRAIALAVTLVSLLIEILRTTAASSPPHRQRADDWDVEVEGESDHG